MSDLSPKQPSTSPMIGGFEDTFATADLQKAVRAFSYIVKSEEIYDRIDLSSEAISSEYMTPIQSSGYYAGKLMLAAINRIREVRADHLYVKGSLILEELEEREAEAR